MGLEPTIFRLEGGRDIHFRYKSLTTSAGIEPATLELTAPRSTNWATKSNTLTARLSLTDIRLAWIEQATIRFTATVKIRYAI